MPYSCEGWLPTRKPRSVLPEASRTTYSGDSRTGSGPPVVGNDSLSGASVRPAAAAIGTLDASPISFWLARSGICPKYTVAAAPT